MASDNDNINQEGVEGSEESKHSTWKDIIKEEFQKINTEFPLSGGETEEDLKRADDSEEGEQSGTAAEENKEHHSLLDNIIHKVSKLDTEFPLSGGETEEDLRGVDDKEEGE